ncbi:hypothetical protein Q31a_40010 [Aureliella helgolandensis]|uniref:Uncharacterized protein n=1 Tax=Aureliella helgolandensis TaxID=2527968 RepID=A0A518GAP6_9BACT|nr:hypothetical protein Q31a_40010 [Aureliella helgolandensis]
MINVNRVAARPAWGLLTKPANRIRRIEYENCSARMDVRRRYKHPPLGGNADSACARPATSILHAQRGHGDAGQFGRATYRSWQ